jgi:hypothetical protein
MTTALGKVVMDRMVKLPEKNSCDVKDLENV